MTEKVKEFTDPSILSIIIKDSLSALDIKDFIKEFRVEADCSEDSEQSVDLMSFRLAEGYFKDTDLERSLDDWLSQENEIIVLKISSMKYRVAKEYIQDELYIRDGYKVGNILWAIANDKKKNLNKLAKKFEIGTSQLKFSVNSNERKVEENYESVEDSLLEPIFKDEKKFDSRLDQLIADFQRLRQEVDSKLLKLDEIKEETDEARSRFQAYRGKVRELSSEVSELKNKVSGLEQAKKELEIEVCEKERLNEDFTNLESENEKSRVEIQKLKEELERLNSNLKSREIDYFNIKQERDELLETVYQLKSSSGKKDKTGNRLGIFVDTLTLYKNSLEIFDAKIDFNKLINFISTGKRKLVKANAYIIESEDSRVFAFQSSLKKVGFNTISKKIEDHGLEVDWKIGIATDIVSWMDELDIVVIACGGGIILN